MFRVVVASFRYACLSACQPFSSHLSAYPSTLALSYPNIQPSTGLTSPYFLPYSPSLPRITLQINCTHHYPITNTITNPSPTNPIPHELLTPRSPLPAGTAASPKHLTSPPNRKHALTPRRSATCSMHCARSGQGACAAALPLPGKD